jgi:hypothetical protein
VGGGFLHVAERYPGIQRCGDERVPERMGTNGLINPQAAWLIYQSAPSPRPWPGASQNARIWTTAALIAIELNAVHIGGPARGYRGAALSLAARGA